MNKAIMLLLVISFLLVSSSTGTAFDGPFQANNRFPLFLHAGSSFLESASIENSFSTGLSHSSVYLVRESEEWLLGLDMEITELNFRYRKTIKNYIEFGIDVPVISFHAGFMDGFLKWYHDAFGYPDYGRSNRQADDFLYEVWRNGKLIIKGKSGYIGIGDTRLTVKKSVLPGDPFISIKGDLEMPTGNVKRGFGNGSIDAGISILIDKQVSENLKTYWNLGVVFPGDLHGYEHVDLKNFLYGGSGIEAAVWRNFSFLWQVFLQGSPFPRTEISSVDRIAVLLSLGGRYTSGDRCYEFSFTEDPNTSGAPDFTINVSFKKRF